MRTSDNHTSTRKAHNHVRGGRIQRNQQDRALISDISLSSRIGRKLNEDFSVAPSRNPFAPLSWRERVWKHKQERGAVKTRQRKGLEVTRGRGRKASNTDAHSDIDASQAITDCWMSMKVNSPSSDGQQSVTSPSVFLDATSAELEQMQDHRSDTAASSIRCKEEETKTSFSSRALIKWMAPSPVGKSTDVVTINKHIKPTDTLVQLRMPMREIDAAFEPLLLSTDRIATPCTMKPQCKMLVKSANQDNVLVRSRPALTCPAATRAAVVRPDPLLHACREGRSIQTARLQDTGEFEVDSEDFVAARLPQYETPWDLLDDFVVVDAQDLAPSATRADEVDIVLVEDSDIEAPWSTTAIWNTAAMDWGWQSDPALCDVQW